ncbi:MAG: M4 family metallopeptidase [Ignavibacteriaceae bacterium]|jgi:bacillolysin/thermolysin
MKYLLTITLLVVVTFFSFGFKGTGIKQGDLKVKVVRNNPLPAFQKLKAITNSGLNIEWNENFTVPSSITGDLTKSGYVRNNSRKEDVLTFLTENKELFGLQDPTNELNLLTTTSDELGQTHLKFQQKYENVILFRGQLIVHISGDGKVIGVNGKYYPTLTFNTKPNILPDQAVVVAKKFLERFDFVGENTELVLMERGINFYLAYAVKLPSKFMPNMVVYVDAKSGEVIYNDDGIRYDGPQVGTGVDLKGQTKQINTYLYGGAYYMVNTTLPMYVAPFDSLKGVVSVYDAKNDTSGNGYNSAALISDPNNDNNFNDNVNLKAAVSTHLFVRDAYNFYKNHYNRNSYDNAGHSMINVVHYKDKYNNAFWNGAAMTYGDGDDIEFSNLAGAYDVIVHELTHAVTERTANLIYENQQGALNESISDCFASLADSANWLIGEEVYTPNTANDALRNMLQPHNNAATGSNSWQPEHMNEFVTLPNTVEGDNGGVHINSGIPNRAFALTAEAITRWKAGQIWYRALTTYLTNNSNFNDARVACINAAKDLYGNNSTEMNAVKTSFEAVGITESTGGQTVELIYDDGTPTTVVYEMDANWELAVKFTPPTNNVNITKCQVYISGDNTFFGNASFALKMYNSGNNGLPGQSLIDPYTYIPPVAGWQVFNITGVSVPGDFFVSVKYDGINSPLIGAALPPGNGRAYESNGSTWVKLTSPNDFTMYMRATIQTPTGVVEISTQVPDKFEVFQNYPNPFNPSTSIAYTLPKSELVNLSVYDLSGRKISELVNNDQNPGTYEVTWNGKNSRGENTSSGIYFYQLNAGTYKSVKKMILIR